MTFVSEVLVEHHQRGDTIGIGESKPRLSWKVINTTNNWIQKKYEVRIDYSDSETVVSSSKESSQSVFVDWPFEALKSKQRVQVSVRVQGEADINWSVWSDSIYIETAIMSSSEFCGNFIASSEPKTDQEILFRKEFMLRDSIISRARLYSTARGVYEVEINGKKVGHEYLSPGWTSYTHRIIQSTNDVGDLVKGGSRNAIGIRVADGWFSGLLGFGGGKQNLYGDKNMVIAQLEVTYEDGVVDIVSSDDSWSWIPGPILYASLYNGERYDARLEITGWSRPGVCSGNWKQVTQYPIDVSLEPPIGPPIRCTQKLKPVRIFSTPSGKTIVDFGQNAAGIVHINTIKAAKGHKITISHAEVMENGELGTRPLRNAKNIDEYIFQGKENGEEWVPRFVYHGFRYAQIDNWPGSPLTENCVEFLVLNSDFERTGWFECSHEHLNKLHKNVCWSMRSNFLSIPTDCPQRDERLGWTGDIQLFSPTANYLYRCQGLLKNWLLDLALEQKDIGIPPVVIPSLQFKDTWGNQPCAAWQDAAIIVPWQLYQQTEDLNILKHQYESMSNWLKEIPKDVDGLLWDHSCFQYGDWLDPDAPPDQAEKTKTDPNIVSDAYLIHCTDIIANVARILGKHQESQYHEQRAKLLRKKFNYEYLTCSGRIASYSQTAYALLIMFDLLDSDKNQLRVAGDTLQKIVKMDQFKVGTGFVGTPIICDALTRIGHADYAYKMLLNEKKPSWLYPITMGATTTWERWDSMQPDGSINVGEMTSFNHYAFGAIADWIHRNIGGLQAAAPGWKKVVIRPLIGERITYATAKHNSLYGMISSSWKILDDDGSMVELTVEIPPNTTGVIELPNGCIHNVGSGKYVFRSKIG